MTKNPSAVNIKEENNTSFRPNQSTIVNVRKFAINAVKATTKADSTGAKNELEVSLKIAAV